MKKLKKGDPYSVSEDPKIRFKHESLSLDFDDLLKGTDAMKKKLQIMKQKKQTIFAEVRFLKQRYNYLKSNPNITHRRGVNDKKGKSSMKKQTLGLPTNPIFDLNQNARFLFQRPGLATSKSSNFDLNRGKRFHGGSEAGKRIVAPIFDLNQVLTEEELQASDKMPLKMEEMKKSYLRNNDGDEYRTETKMAIRPGNGSRRVGKRKISWQDQVALRV